MVIPYETGIFVKYGSSSDIADALIYISKNDNYSRMSKACIKQFKSKFTRDKHLLRITLTLKAN